MHRPASAIKRVLNRIEMIPIAGCWIFTGALNEAGYGIVGNGARGTGVDRAHRITYRHFVGEIPDGMFVCHKCDQPACCNPHHLFLGTPKENHHDSMRKKRSKAPPLNPHIVGEVHYKHKLTDDDVREIRKIRETGVWHKVIAEKYGVSKATIQDACSRRTWKHVK